ncbi:beta-ketoacyl-[acyl-carrier-protein] synthase family protein [Catenuloplanes indicus]|uniref:3-oxoacyl-[acyl-carrier-protein] synthase II n=1 Tax=Catenuloplanes indicus TaxID=137267 RepID=A0AAE3VUE0_9ACTN|nr:beta-ketoacyl synthase N-terminal-like domain-containing protein [Catenuloplanes indicus]MDQ0363896.1 3-oxoacyl-[acyl-carrier-protein] synthase II [Catenuloplanes indicus]
MTDVLVTGIGAVSACGAGAPRLWRAMSAAEVRLPDRADDPLAHMDLPMIYRVPGHDDAGLGRASSLAVRAAREAVGDAGLSGTGARTGVVMGSCMGDADVVERAGDLPGPRPFGQPFPVAARVGARFGAHGPNISVAAACAAGGFAIGIAADLIRTGEADVVLAGGADGYSRVALACFNRLGAVDPVRCRPFDARRAGTVFGEGAGVLVLERGDHARARGATAYGRVAESGWSCDAFHPTAPDPAGTQIVRAMRAALGPAPAPVGCVIPHGTGTRHNDLVESQALHTVFDGGPPPLYSVKALLGHTGGAAAALAACAAALILRAGRIPPNVPVEHPDPDCPVDLPGGERPLTDGRVLVNAYAFGGSNASLLIETAS